MNSVITLAAIEVRLISSFALPRLISPVREREYRNQRNARERSEKASQSTRRHQLRASDQPPNSKNGQLVSHHPPPQNNITDRQTDRHILTINARVSMLIMGHPQFPTQDDLGIGEGIPPIPEWQLDPTPSLQEIPGLSYLEIDSAVKNVFVRLRAAFTAASLAPFQPTRLHDLTCFVVHRLLLSASHSDSDSIPDQTDLPSSPSPSPSPLTESIRYAIILYMLIIQGPTYYTHAVIANTLTDRFLENLTRLDSSSVPDSFLIWLIGIGMVASSGTHQYPWFVERAYHVSASIQSGSGSAWWDHILGSLKSVLWLETPHSEDIFRPHWDAVLGGAENHFPGVGVAVSVPSALPMRIGSLQLG